jgi:hypothetical protein
MPKRALDSLFEVRAARPGRPTFHDYLELAILVLVLVLSFATPPRGADGAANAPLQGWLQEKTGGGVCLYRRVTGIECPGCGLSRGFVQFAHGQPVEAMRLNPLTPVIFFMFLTRLVGTAALCVTRREISNRIPWWIAWKLYGALFAALITLGIYRIVTHFVT